MTRKRLRKTPLKSLLAVILLAAACTPASLSGVSASPTAGGAAPPSSAPPSMIPAASTQMAETTATLQPSPSATATETGTGRHVQFEERLADVEFSLPLTVQHISGSSAWVYFGLEPPVEGEVFYWEDGKEEPGVYAQGFEAVPGTHLIELKDLKPDTLYEVRVGLPSQNGTFRSPGLNGETWGVTALRTYPQELDHLRVAVIGDSGFGESITFALAAQIAASDPDFVIHVGDLVYSVFENGTPLRAYQAKYFWPFQKVLQKAPIYAVPGNHEYYSDAAIGEQSFYFEVFPPLMGVVQDGSWFGSQPEEERNWFEIRLMGYQFLFLDSQRFYLPGGAAEETAWLQARLDEFSGPTIGVYHIATYSSGNHASDGIPIRGSWIPYFRENNTALILSGHEHNYERLRIDGIEFVTTGGGSRSLYSLSTPVEGSLVFAAVSHFVLLDLYPDQIELRSINEFGDVIDKTRIEIPN